MKKLVLLLCIGINVSFTACQKDQNENNVSSFHVTAKKNNSAWTAVNMEAYRNNNTDTIIIIAHAIPNGQSLPEQTLVMGVKASSKGNYHALAQLTRYYNTVGLDVVVSEYRPLNKIINPIKITDYDKQANTIKGTFSLSLQNVYPGTAGNADAVFSSGSFYVPLRNQHIVIN